MFLKRQRRGKHEARERGATFLVKRRENDRENGPWLPVRLKAEGVGILVFFRKFSDIPQYIGKVPRAYRGQSTPQTVISGLGRRRIGRGFLAAQ